jgi:hypothetical protein
VLLGPIISRLFTCSNEEKNKNKNKQRVLALVLSLWCVFIGFFFCRLYQLLFQKRRSQLNSSEYSATAGGWCQAFHSIEWTLNDRTSMMNDGGESGKLKRLGQCHVYTDKS